MSKTINTKISVDALSTGQLHRWKYKGELILLTQHQGKIVAFSAECPHASADLSKGSYVNGRVTCPDHDWKFDIHTGRTLYPEDEGCRLKRFTTSVENGVVFLEIR